MSSEELEIALAEVLGGEADDDLAWADAVVVAATAGAEPLDTEEELAGMRAFANALEYAGVEDEVRGLDDGRGGPSGEELLRGVLGAPPEAPAERATPGPSPRRPRLVQGAWLAAATVLLAVGAWLLWADRAPDPHVTPPGYDGRTLGPNGEESAALWDWVDVDSGAARFRLTELPEEYAGRRAELVYRLQERTETGDWRTIDERELPSAGIDVAGYRSGGARGDLRVEAWLPSSRSATGREWETGWTGVE